MSLAAPIFNPAEFELRGYTNPYFTTAQQTQVDLVEARVNGQLDWVAQLLGWNGPNYWSDSSSASQIFPYPGLPGNVDQKRQLLTGSFGYYDGYIYPQLVSVHNWNNTVTVKADPRIAIGQQVYLGTDTYSIQNITPQEDNYILDLGTLPQSFFDNIAANNQLKIYDITLCPAPFYRPSVGISGDASFVCGRDDSGVNLIIYPGFDANQTLPYFALVFFPESKYYFDQNVFLSYENDTRKLDSVYDPEKQLWYLQIPQTNTIYQLPPAASLVWPLYDPNTGITTEAIKPVSILNWNLNSDWNNIKIVDNFTGTWGNKGGFLPYNFVFDALSLHGFNEAEGVRLRESIIDVPYRDLLNAVYAQQVTLSDQAPGNPSPGDVWWNTITGTFSFWIEYAGACSAWVQVDFRDPVSDERPPEVELLTVTDFLSQAQSLPVNTTVSIANVQGLGNTDPNIQILGLNDTLIEIGTGYLFKVDQQGSTSVWKLFKLIYDDVSLFNGDALKLPYKTPVSILNSNGLEAQDPNANYIVKDLKFTSGSISDSDVGVVLSKFYNERTWVVSPDSILPYIAETSISPIGDPLNGETWWEYRDPLAVNRAATLYYEDSDSSQWVQFDAENPLNFSEPPALFNPNSLVVYCEGIRVQPDYTFTTDNYTFRFSSGPTYTFEIKPTSGNSILQLPDIKISDSLTGLFIKDITYLLFPSGAWQVYPSTVNSQTPLRLWKTQSLQVCDTVELLNREIYTNPLVADQNLGPANGDWPIYYVRLPFEYQRNGYEWQQVGLICQDFGYFGSSLHPERVKCPPEEELPYIYEQLATLPEFTQNLKVAYTEPYWYSNAIITEGTTGTLDYENAFIGPTLNLLNTGFTAGSTVPYDPFHNRRADVTSPPGSGYGDWVGEYFSINSCYELTGFTDDDLLSGAIVPTNPPTWDSSIYKLPPGCPFSPTRFDVDMNDFRIGYAYFAADLSAANEAFFDIEQEVAWRYPQTLPETGYITPTSVAG